jgi:hypothetical protein
MTEPAIMAAFTAGVGVLVSLRAATVQQATLTMTAIFLLSPQVLIAALLILHEVFGKQINTPPIHSSNRRTPKAGSGLASA